MNRSERISAFCGLGQFFREYTDGHVPAALKPIAARLDQLITGYKNINAWFTEDHIMHALTHWGNVLACLNVSPLLDRYEFPEKGKTIALIMPGNIPMVGFHDFFCILIAGHSAMIRVSSKDPELPVIISEILCTIEPRFKERIQFTDNLLKGFDAVIATGSSQSEEQFRKYFAKYPNIIRGNRTSVAVLTGNETETELEGLAEDIFRYFGLGCRNVTKVFVPENYRFDPLYNALVKWQWMHSHNKWANNYDYHKSVFLMNRIDFSDGGFFILKKDDGFFPPLSVIFYSDYSDICILAAKLKEMESHLQCVVSKSDTIDNALPFGTTQQPDLNQFADGTDTLHFLCNV